MKLYYFDTFPQIEILAIPLTQLAQLAELPENVRILGAKTYGRSYALAPSYDSFVTTSSNEEMTLLALKITSPYSIKVWPYTVLQFTTLDDFLDRIKSIRENPPLNWDENVEPRESYS